MTGEDSMSKKRYAAALIMVSWIACGLVSCADRRYLSESQYAPCTKFPEPERNGRFPGRTDIDTRSPLYPLTQNDSTAPTASISPGFGAV